MAPAEPLTTDFIQDDDITPEQAMSTALSWAGSYHGVVANYNGLRGWIVGLRAGQQMMLNATEVPDDQDKATNQEGDQESLQP